METVVFVLGGLALVASFIGIGVLCTFITPWFVTLALVEGLALGWVVRDA